MMARITAALLLTLALGNGAWAGEDYFLLMFGSQRTPNEPNFSHSFATFVRADWVSPVAPRLHPAGILVTVGSTLYAETRS